MSFQISITPNRRVAGRFIAAVRRSIQKALVEERAKRGLTQADIARAIGVHRSVVNRELVGRKDITLGRVAELAWALGRIPKIELLEPATTDRSNVHWSYGSTPFDQTERLPAALPIQLNPERAQVAFQTSTDAVAE
jgi:transcriptional regulator with XRE-family HTH domain